uniref:Uncharacterized protein n=1 Tax=Callorhinchus milii TaxID=7868 RepID=A0A4W3GZS0_CALMI
TMFNPQFSLSSPSFSPCLRFSSPRKSELSKKCTNKYIFSHNLLQFILKSQICLCCNVLQLHVIDMNEIVFCTAATNAYIFTSIPGLLLKSRYSLKNTETKRHVMIFCYINLH